MKNKIIIWPVYFDSKSTRSGGRRIPRSRAVPAPKILEIKEAVERLGLDHEVTFDASHPKTPWSDTGMLLISGRKNKNQMIKKIAGQLSKAHKAPTKK